MSTFPGCVERRDAKGVIEERIESSAARSLTMKRAFQLSLRRRRDRKSWEILERTVAKALDRDRAENRDVDWLSQADANLQASAAAFIKSAAPYSNRSSDYRRSAKSACPGASSLGQGSDAADAAYWRHCALVWITLWHLADLPQMTAEEAKAGLGFGFMQGDAPASVLPFAPRKRLDAGASALEFY
ncbi:MAG: hypothetical protein WAN43_04000 [Rhodomicrobium sp.]|jgi:hypothetical protein